jgi:antitoxin component YwqK of YwqJK toxin-antitoxin module
MFEYNFSYNDILSSSVVKKEGMLFEDEQFTFESYWENGINHYERLFYTTDKGQKAPFTGLLYELYPNGNILGYIFYKDGYEEGTNVDFYDNGRVSKYSSFDKDSNKTLIIKWFRNGQISGVTELTDHGLHKKFIEYDENGSIIRKGDV